MIRRLYSTTITIGGTDIASHNPGIAPIYSETQLPSPFEGASQALFAPRPAAIAKQSQDWH
jgi:hypothetical protein